MIKLRKLKFLQLVVLLIAVFACAGCGSSEPKNEKLNWTVNVMEVQVKEQMAAVDDVRQYDGSIAKVPHKNQPKSGNVYVLVSLDLKKNVSGNHPFAWQNLVLKDKKGATYNRIQDVFLTDYKISRLSGTDLKLDAKGWICFEVPKQMADGLELVYKENDKQNIFKLKK